MLAKQNDDSLRYRTSGQWKPNAASGYYHVLFNNTVGMLTKHI